MSELKYTESHEWLRLEADGTATVGITDFAQAQLGDIVYIELPEVGAEFTPGADAATVESVKSAGEIKMPLAGRIVAVNEELNADPALVNGDAEGAGWFFRMAVADPDAVAGLLSHDAYQQLIA